MTPGSPRPQGQPRRSRPLRVADAIKDWVVERGLKPGDRLPGEAELIAQFGMSKGTIREAMRLLQAQGLVETKTGPGGGSFVGEVSRERANALLANYFYFRDVSIDDIYQVRIALEPEQAAKLAGCLTESQLAELEAIMAEYADPAADAEEERRQHVASLRFHARLSDFGQNALLSFFINFMSQILTDLTVYKRLYKAPNHDLWQQGRDHQVDLIEALRQGDADRAREVMRSHMEMARRLMEAQEAEVMKRFIAE
ncbi:FCD domain-containing protein [Marinovum sp. SP66]|jgi:GntR family transcriptional repressor for pyruvate dehydrogenase complex|uniref:FadR/GntR family transcriptional regulator n=1 Tax=Marinovum TaxID=367771 RepID=UPI00065B2316|nr:MULTISPECIES: FCD domain-containing protein [unclassified Marinovum]AKO99347.1 Transcriptional regulator [Marinovum algicola DG 898]MDD9740953.1 FCD domain-containing protein [Marinovum sp. SP66]MDD9745928.1 FCD domain-containing protein [Marinovum sp. PR37]